VKNAKAAGTARWASEAERVADYRRRNRAKVLAAKKARRVNMTEDQREHERQTRRERYARKGDQIRVVQKRWRDQNRDRVAAANRRYREKHPETLAEYERSRRPARDPDKERERARRMRAERPELPREYARRYRARLRREEPEKVRRRHRSINARHKRAQLTADALDYAAVLDGDPCSYCGGPANTIDHIDAIQHGGSSCWSNLTMACKPCNSRKHTHRLVVFLAR
jgi:5-methylcytosine-specific restriction endonuclease McrA